MTRTTREGDFILIERDGIVENKHEVHAAVISSSGKILYHLGDPHRMTLIHSSAKPAQALAVVETGALEQFSFDEADLALICGSHSSEDRHINRAKAMLSKAQNKESDLRCGGHPAVLTPAINNAWTKSGFTPTPVCSACSGKHAGMLAGAKAMGAPTANYNAPDHPIQARVRKVVEELSGMNEDDVKWRVDGCDMLSPAVPLRCHAHMYASFAQARDAMEHDKEVSPRTQNMSRVYNAMARHPEMVAGEGRFCTVLMQAFEESLIAKLGAEGCFGIGIRESERTRALGSDGAIGISVKIEDGNFEMVYTAVAEILHQLQIGTPEMRGRLETFHHPKIKNTVGVVNGNVSFSFKLRPS